MPRIRRRFLLDPAEIRQRLSSVSWFMRCLAETPETSQFTSVYKRMQALCPEVANAVVLMAETSAVDASAATVTSTKSRNSDCEAELREACSPAELRNTLPMNSVPRCVQNLIHLPRKGAAVVANHACVQVHKPAARGACDALCEPGWPGLDFLGSPGG